MAKRNRKTKTDYDDYLASPLWKRIRKRVLARDGGRCRECGAQATSVHHLSYTKAVMAGEDDGRLVSLCSSCHEKQHPDKVYPKKRLAAEPPRGKHAKTIRRAQKRRRRLLREMARDRLFHARMCDRYPRTSAGSHSGSVDPSEAKARAVPTSGEIGQYEIGLSLAKSR